MHVKFILFFVLLVINTNPVKCQNLIRNGSFENAKPYKGKLLWSMAKKDFDLNMKYWTSPTGGTPDIILNRYRDKVNFEREGLNLTPCLPRTGKSVVAIRSYGCKNLTPHCREYIQAKTTEILKKDCTYKYEFYVQPSVTSVRINNIGIGFEVKGKNELYNDKMLESDNVQIHEDIAFTKIGDWVRIQGEYKMDKDYNFILIGNFFNDANTKKRIVDGGMSTAYYLIDDVSINLSSCPDGTIGTPSRKLVLEDILFEHDSAVLKSDLRHTYEQIKSYSFTEIKITGYTDSTGTHEYNNNLSLQRARVVMTTLNKLGIPIKSMKAEGMGSRNPISLVDKRMNRRVELIIK